MGNWFTAITSDVSQSLALAEIGALLLVMGVAAFIAVRIKFSVVP
ncbi:MAG: hypothetical protein RLZ82_891, partial [Actinomycetota bacterium]